MGSPPTGSEVVVVVATPLLRVDVPSTVEPLVNDTVPVTLLGRVSVNVTEAFTTDGLTEEVSVDVGLALDTIWVTVPVAEL
jgi:hypothetical protein